LKKSLRCPRRKEIVVFVIRIIKWVFRRFAGRAIPGLSGASLTSVVTGLLGQKGSQLPGLLEKLNAGGLGSLVQSWVGTGKNLPLRADQVKSALGSSTLSGIAGQLGVSEDKAASKVAGALPQIINKLTPDGQVPNQEALAKSLAALLK
jgi:uncharacterized protein YidB (DUF937 family)